MLGIDEKPTAMILTAIGFVYFLWTYLGRCPRKRVSKKLEGCVIGFEIVVLNPGGQPFTIGSAVAKKGVLFTHPLVMDFTQEYRPWPAGKKIDFNTPLNPGEQKTFTVMAGGDGKEKFKIKLKRVSSLLGPRLYNLVVC